MSQTKRQALEEAREKLWVADNVLQAMDLPLAAKEARRTSDTLLAILRNMTNPKYGGEPSWTGGPA